MQKDSIKRLDLIVGSFNELPTHLLARVVDFNANVTTTSEASEGLAKHIDSLKGIDSTSQVEMDVVDDMADFAEGPFEVKYGKSEYGFPWPIPLRTLEKLCNGEKSVPLTLFIKTRGSLNLEFFPMRGTRDIGYDELCQTRFMSFESKLSESHLIRRPQLLSASPIILETRHGISKSRPWDEKMMLELRKQAVRGLFRAGVIMPVIVREVQTDEPLLLSVIPIDSLDHNSYFGLVSQIRLEGQQRMQRVKVCLTSRLEKKLDTAAVYTVSNADVERSVYQGPYVDLSESLRDQHDTFLNNVNLDTTNFQPEFSWCVTSEPTEATHLLIGWPETLKVPTGIHRFAQKVEIIPENDDGDKTRHQESGDADDDRYAHSSILEELSTAEASSRSGLLSQSLIMGPTHGCVNECRNNGVCRSYLKRLDQVSHSCRCWYGYAGYDCNEVVIPYRRTHIAVLAASNLAVLLPTITSIMIIMRTKWKFGHRQIQDIIWSRELGRIFVLLCAAATFLNVGWWSSVYHTCELTGVCWLPRSLQFSGTMGLPIVGSSEVYLASPTNVTGQNYQLYGEFYDAPSQDETVIWNETKGDMVVRKNEKNIKTASLYLDPQSPMKPTVFRANTFAKSKAEWAYLRLFDFFFAYFSALLICVASGQFALIINIAALVFSANLVQRNLTAPDITYKVSVAALVILMLGLMHQAWNGRLILPKRQWWHLVKGLVLLGGAKFAWDASSSFPRLYWLTHSLWHLTIEASPALLLSALA